MPSAHLSRVPGIEPAVAHALLGSNLSSARDVLMLSVVDLIELLNITQAQALNLQQAVSAHVCPAFTSALDLLQQARVVLRTALPTLDASFPRGVSAGGITELVGPAGVGKSQMCFQLSLLCAAPLSVGGLGAATIFIDTERKFSPVRFAEMARSRFPAHFGHGAADSAEMLKATMSRVLLLSPPNSSQLLKCLETLEAGVIQHSACLVIVDSVAALARADFGGTAGMAGGLGSGGSAGGAGGGSGGGSIMERQEMLGSVAGRLKQLAEAFRIPVVVTNQVTTRMSGAAASHAFQNSGNHRGAAPPSAWPAPPPGEARGVVTAALGTKWAHCVNVRLVLERLSDRRFLKVVKSPSSAETVLEYSVCAAGVEEVVGAPLPPALADRNVLTMSIANEVDYYRGVGDALM